MSSDVIVLHVTERTETGKSVKHLRREGIVPGNVYERGKPSVAVQGVAMEMTKVYAHAGKHHPVELYVGKSKHLAMIKDVDFDPVKGFVRHIAFHAVNKNDTVTAEIPVRLTDDIPALRANLMVLTPTDMVEVEAIPANLPDELVVDAAALVEIGDRLTVADITVPEGVVIMTDPEFIIGVVEEPKDQMAAVAADIAQAAEQTAESAEAEVPAANGEPEDAPAEK